MATVDQAEKTLRDLQTARNNFGRATTSSAGVVFVGRRSYTQAEFDAEVARLDKAISELETQLGPVRKAKEELKKAKQAASPRTRPAGVTPAQAQAAVNEAQKVVDGFAGLDITVPSEAVAPAVGAATPAQQEGLRRRGEVAGGFGRTMPRTPTGPTGPTGPKETVRTGQKPTGPTGPKTQKLPDNWEAKFREMFPGQSWWLDIDRAKYPDVVEVLKRGVLNEAWKTPEAQTRFVAEFNNTSFYKELASTGKVRQIRQLIGDAGFDSVPFNDFVTKAMNLGWDNDTLKFEAYKEAFRKDDTGQFVNPTAVTRIKKSNDYLGIANIGKAYFNQVSDDTIQRTLTGEMTTEDVQRQQREVAKARYGHLSPLIDQGLTLDEISGSFKTAAAQLLEVDPNTIDMSNAQYEVALNFGEEGKKRVMTNGEWQKLLRTDARYGWDKTENAKREAREWASALRQTFGRII